MSTHLATLRPFSSNWSKIPDFPSKKFQIGGMGPTRGFHVFGFTAKDAGIVIDKALPSASFYKLTFSQKVIHITGKPFPAWVKSYESWINLVGPRALQQAEESVKKLAGLGSVPVSAAGVLSAPARRHQNLDLIKAVLWGKGQLNQPDTNLNRWFNLLDAVVIRPAISDVIVSYCLGDPTTVVGKTASFLLNQTFEWMRGKTEDFFDPPMGNGSDGPPPPPPPPGEDSASESHRRENKKIVKPDGSPSGGDVDPENPRHDNIYRRFPERNDDIRRGLCALGMTYAGATCVLTGLPVTGHDAEVVRWIGTLAKIQCLNCNLMWFVPESTLSLYLLHLPSHGMNLVWCRRCRHMTPSLVTRVGGIYI